MTAFTLVVRPDGHAILTTRERISSQKGVEIRNAFLDWDAGNNLMVIGDCDVVQVTEVELDISEPAVAS